MLEPAEHQHLALFVGQGGQRPLQKAYFLSLADLLLRRAFMARKLPAALVIFLRQRDFGLALPYLIQ
jgi:hypothetical protein